MAKPRLTIVLGVRVNPRLAEALKRLEKARQLDKSDLIREALEQYLYRQGELDERST